MSRSDHELAIALVDTGANVVRRCHGTALQRVEKGAGDFATNVDLDAEAAMCELLCKERPCDAIVGEESGNTGARDTSRRWLIDPLCGTLNYAVGMQAVAVNAALDDDGSTHTAAVADPFSGETFWTQGNRAYARQNSRDRVLAPSAQSRLVDLNFDAPYPSAPAFTTVALAGSSLFTSVFRPRVVSTSLALTWVATGQRAAYVTDGDVTNSVHFAAGLCLCEAAGCVLTNLHGEDWRDHPVGLIAAADSTTHRQLRCAVRTCFGT